MKRSLSLLILLMVFLCTGCPIPVVYTLQPGIRGKIIDIDTGQPIANAKVALASVYCETQTEYEKLATSCTNQDGTFCISPKQQWGICLIPSDPPTRCLILSVEKDNYLSLIQDFKFMLCAHMPYNSPPNKDFGELRLRQKKD